MPQLELASLSKSYDDIVAVAGVSLRVRPGELVSLLGPSGCGKTTTLRMIAGFVTPSSGSIVLDGRDITALPPHARNMGLVFQSYALFPHMTVAENIGFGLKVRGLARGETADRVDRAIDLVGLHAFRRRYPAALSGGQQQRVALARALVIEPDVLLLDEPLSNLDAGLRLELRDQIRALQQRLGITTVFVTHDQEEALAISDRVVVMADGRVVEIAAPRELCDAPRALFTTGFLGERTAIPGRVEIDAGRALFRSAEGLTAQLPDGAGPGLSHLVLRAARLALDAAPAEGALLSWPVTVRRIAYEGDRLSCIVATSRHEIRVVRSTALPDPLPGQGMVLNAFEGAVSWLDEKTTEPA